MVTLKVSGMNGDEDHNFADLESAKDWIYSEDWSLAEDLIILDEHGKQVFATDGI